MRYMATPLSIRFDDGVLERLRQASARQPGGTPSGLAQRLVDEGLRQAEHPGVVFKDGPSGRRAALAQGPDVWEVVVALADVDERGEDAVEAVAELMSLPVARVRVALRYYGAYPDEVDAQVEKNDRTAQAAHAAWQRGQQLLA